MRLKDWRSTKGLTQAQVAAELGVGPLAVASWEQQTRTPGVAYMIEIFRLTEGAVTPNDFYDLPDLSAGERRDAA